MTSSFTCGRQVENVRNLIMTAQDRDETDQYIARCAGRVSRDEGFLQAASADSEQLERVKFELEVRIAAVFDAAGLSPASHWLQPIFVHLNACAARVSSLWLRRCKVHDM